MTAQAQRFGDDILLHECDKAYSIKTKISVADNGWIYVLMSKYGHPTERDEFKIYRSIDGGKNFEAIFSGQFLEDFRQVGMDLVVTGNDPSNITIWFVHACNNTETEEARVTLYKINVMNVITCYKTIMITQYQ